MRTLVTTMTAAWLIGACAPDGAGRTEQASTAQAILPIPTSPLPQMAHPSCNPRRVVGVSMWDSVEQIPLPCPAPTAPWTGGNAFPGSNPPTLLGRSVCAYTLPEGVPYTLQGLPHLPASETSATPVPPEQWAVADCPAVTTMSDGGDEALALAVPEFIKLYRGQIRRATTLPILTSSVPARVEVAILDSLNDQGQPEDPAHARRAQHGRAIKELISDLTCPLPRRANSACRVSLRTYQLFDADGGDAWLADAREGEAGDRKSASGYLMTLAQKIDAAVQSAKSRGVARLIINLSVGYHPRFSGLRFNEDVVNLERATRAVNAALDKAVCNGALVIAAIGNREDGTAPWNRPVFPGYSQQFRSSCNRGPLVYGASGLGPQRTPLANSIDWPYSATRKVETPLAAPGFAVASAGNAGGPLPLMTGSSFGAAGVSAVAALVWSYRPELTPSQVMAIVHETGINTGRSASHVPASWPGTGANATHVKSVSACSAVFTAYLTAFDRVCSATPRPAGCDTAAPIACDSNSSVTPGTGAALLSLVPQNQRLALQFAPAGTIPPACGLAAENVRVSGGQPGDYCPWLKPNEVGAAFDPEAQPAQPIPLHHTPPHKPCVPCVVVKTDPTEPPTDDDEAGTFLLVNIDQAFHRVLTNPTLRSGSKVLSLGDAWIPAAQQGLVALSLPADFQGSDYALTFTKTDDGTSVTSYVPKM